MLRDVLLTGLSVSSATTEAETPAASSQSAQAVTTVRVAASNAAIGKGTAGTEIARTSRTLRPSSGRVLCLETRRQKKAKDRGSLPTGNSKSQLVQLRRSKDVRPEAEAAALHIAEAAKLLEPLGGDEELLAWVLEDCARVLLKL